MGLLDWLSGGKKAPAPEVSVQADPEAKPFGIDKPISECTDEDIRRSNELFQDASLAAGRVIGWEYDCGGDYQSTLFELAVDGMRAKRKEDLPPRPEGLEMRAAILPFTRTHQMREERGDVRETSVCYLAKTREELEGFCEGIYAKKTTKKQTKGKCYYCGFRYKIPMEPGQSGAAHFLQHTNHLTRQVVLGDELAVDFEESAAAGLSSQQWIEQVLRPQVLAEGGHAS